VYHLTIKNLKEKFSESKKNNQYLCIMITEEKKEQNIKMARKFLADQKLIRQYMHGKITLETLKEHGIKFERVI
jgi:protein-arginine kinase